MLLERRHPFGELHRIYGSSGHHRRGYGALGPLARVNGWSVPLDVVSDGDSVIVRASLPGVKPEDIEVTIEDGTLTIKGGAEVEEQTSDSNYLLRERRTGRYNRTVRLADSIDTANAETRYEDGVLTITLPKAEAKKARRLEIKAA